MPGPYMQEQQQEPQNPWYFAWQPTNNQSMFLLQLHPIYRGIVGLIYGGFGTLLIWSIAKSQGILSNPGCGNGFPQFVLVVGIFLCICCLVNLGVACRRHHQTRSRGYNPQGGDAPGWKDGEPLPPKIEWLFCDWMCTTVGTFVVVGIFNVWFWIFGEPDPYCPHLIKDVSLGFLISAYVYAFAICCFIPFLAFHVSGPSYMYQLDKNERLELQFPASSLKKKNYDTFGMNMSGGEYSKPVLENL